MLTGAGKSELEDLVKPFVAAQGRVIGARADPGEGLSITARTISASPSSACRCSTATAARIWSIGGTAAGHAAAEDYVANRYHKPQDEYDAELELGRRAVRT